MKTTFLKNIVLILVGIVNGLFSTGAGQLLLFYYVYIRKIDTKEAREKTLSIMPIISIPTLFFYYNKSDIEIKNALIFILISLICGFFGNRLMKKINGILLNLISGAFLVVLSIINLWRLFI